MDSFKKFHNNVHNSADILSLSSKVDKDKISEDTVYEALVKKQPEQIIRTAMDKLAGITDIKQLFEHIGRTITALSGRAYILTFSRESDDSLLLVNIHGIRNDIFRKALAVFGANPIGRFFKIEPDYISFYNKRQLHKFETNLFGFAKGQVSEFVANSLERMLGINHIYVVGLEGLNEVIGNVHIFVRHKLNEAQENAIERFIYQAAVALERLQYLKEARKNEKKYRFLIESINEVVCRTDEEGTILYISPGISKISPLSSEEVTGKKYMDYIYPDDYHLAEQFHNKLLKGFAASVELRMTSYTGKVRWIRISGKPNFTGKHVTGITGTLNDISREKEAERALKESEEKYRLLADNSYDVISMWIDDKMTYVSPSIKKMLGYSVAEFMKMDPIELTHSEDREKLRNRAKQVLESKSLEPAVYRYRQLHKEGHYCWLEARVNTTYDSEGRAISVLNIRDISDLTETQNDLSEALEVLEILLASIPALIYFKDTELNYLKVNRYFSSQLDLAPQDVEGKSDYNLFETGVAEIVRCEDKKILETGKPLVNLEQSFYDSNGRKRWMVTNKLPLHTKTGEIAGIVGTSWEVTDLKEAEMKLKDKAEELEKLVAMKDKLFSIIVHDIQNPIHAFMGLGQSLTMSRNSTHQEKVERIGSLVFESAKQVNMMVQNLVVWSRLERGSDKINPEVVTLKAIVSNVFHLLQPSAHKKNISFEDKTDIAHKAFIDPLVIDIILRNLIANSIKFTDKGGRITVGSEIEADMLKIIIDDDGIGIPEELKGILFMPDKMNVRPGTEDEKGTGLGLVLCKDLVEGSGGWIEVCSKDEAGARFCINIPRTGKTGDIL